VRKEFDPEFTQAIMQELKRLQGAPPIPLMVDPLAAFFILSHLQLALRHPQTTGASSQSVRQFVEQLAERVCGESEVLRKMVQSGWDEDFDVVQDAP
jgi:hypothetical protein